jgi:hypothetical protein
MREEVADRRRNFHGVRLQREVSGIQEPNDSAGNVAFERLGASRQEKGVVLAHAARKGGLLVRK